MSPRGRDAAAPPLETQDSLTFNMPNQISRLGLAGLIGTARHFGPLVQPGDDALALEQVSKAMRPALALRPDRDGIPDVLDAIDHSDIANAFWAAKWCTSAFPRVRLRSARAAWFAASAISADVMADVRPPWPAFMVQLEGEPLLIDPEHPGVYYDQIEVLYSTATGTPTWSFWRRAPYCHNYFRLWTTSEEWASDLNGARLFDRDGADPQARIFQVVSRIVLGLCIHLTEPHILDEARHRARSPRFRNVRSGPPQLTNLVIGNDVKVDVGEAIREYVRRGGSSPTVQSLIRGHWKRQPHGPGLSERKWIHVEPYWRGPETGPVLVRAHDVM